MSGFCGTSRNQIVNFHKIALIQKSLYLQGLREFGI